MRGPRRFPATPVSRHATIRSLTRTECVVYADGATRRRRGRLLPCRLPVGSVACGGLLPPRRLSFVVACPLESAGATLAPARLLAGSGLGWFCIPGGPWPPFCRCVRRGLVDTPLCLVAVVALHAGLRPCGCGVMRRPARPARQSCRGLGLGWARVGMRRRAAGCVALPAASPCLQRRTSCTIARAGRVRLSYDRPVQSEETRRCA